MRWPQVLRDARQLISRVSPDLIHSHFVGTTLVLRHALGKKHPIPRVFQVPGPLHLEHSLFRRLELSLAGESDHWIGSSRCIVEHYLRSRVSLDRVFLSYYGDNLPSSNELPVENSLRARVGTRPGGFLVGSVSWMYPPKLYLGQLIGLKAHEDLIDALGTVCLMDPRVRGVIAGGAWGGATWYESRLRARARERAGDRIHFTGALPFAEAKQAWHALDLAVHVPISENCGGVIEPLLAGVPVIASHVGGLPEVIYDGLTGTLIPLRHPGQLAESILHNISRMDEMRKMASRGQSLVRQMFDVDRTAREVHAIYRHILNGEARPAEFDSLAILQKLLAAESTVVNVNAGRPESQIRKEIA